MKVYRLECTLDGQGPWRSDYQPAWVDRVIRRPNGHPRPVPHDEGLGMTDRDVCGCRSLRQLAEWFTVAGLREFLADEYHIKVYDVPDDTVAVGDRQLVFCPDNARAVWALDVKAKVKACYA